MDPGSVADELLLAWRKQKPVVPFTEGEPDFDQDTAYDAQSRFVAGLIESGDRVIGAKVGLTSRAEQNAWYVMGPASGRLTEAMVLPHGDPVPLDQLIQPKVQPAIGLLLGRSLEGPTTLAGVLAATEAVFGAVEVVDSRYEDGPAHLPDYIADNCGAGRLLVGSQARRPGELPDLRLLGCVVRDRAQVVATAAGAATMGHPAAAVTWLANRLAGRDEGLDAGSMVVVTGLTGPRPVAPGANVTVEFDGLGTVDVWA